MNNQEKTDRLALASEAYKKAKLEGRIITKPIVVTDQQIEWMETYLAERYTDQPTIYLLDGKTHIVTDREIKFLIEDHLYPGIDHCTVYSSRYGHRIMCRTDHNLNLVLELDEAPDQEWIEQKEQDYALTLNGIKY